MKILKLVEGIQTARSLDSMSEFDQALISLGTSREQLAADIAERILEEIEERERLGDFEFAESRDADDVDVVPFSWEGTLDLPDGNNVEVFWEVGGVAVGYGRWHDDEYSFNGGYVEDEFDSFKSLDEVFVTLRPVDLHGNIPGSVQGVVEEEVDFTQDVVQALPKDVKHWSFK